MEGNDIDLDRILRLYAIIKRYELLVEHLLDECLIIDGSKSLREYEDFIVAKTLKLNNNNKSKTASDLKVVKKTIYRWVDKKVHGNIGKKKKQVYETV